MILLGTAVGLRPVDSWAKAGRCLEGNCENGHGTFEYATGLKYVGDWQDGNAHGRGRMTMPSGTDFGVRYRVGNPYNHASTYEGDYRNGLPHGHGIFQLEDGRLYDGEWKNGAADGLGFESNPDGSSYEGHWRNGLRNGYGVSTRGGAVDKEGFWVDGEYTGKDRVWTVE